MAEILNRYTNEIMFVDNNKTIKELAEENKKRLSGAELSGTDLSRADLSGAILSGADLRGAKLKYGIFCKSNNIRTYQSEK